MEKPILTYCIHDPAPAAGALTRPLTPLYISFGPRTIDSQPWIPTVSTKE